jgi:glycosyl transferase family 25
MEHVLYINLAKRTDRRLLIEAELSRMGLKGERVAGLDTAPYGYIGCAYAHCVALRTARERGWPSVLILEDDFQFVVDKERLSTLISEARGHTYDVLLLGTNLRHSDRIDALIGKTEHSFTASAYIVNAAYYDTLLNRFEEALVGLATTRNQQMYAIDVMWRRLQGRDRWLHFHERIGLQRSGFSDIELHEVAYGT